jgi:RNA-directed DNA polymerase
VSVVTASSTAAGSAPVDPVRALQYALYRAAKADPGRRFHALRDKIFRKDVLWRAWVVVFRNDGAPGIDGGHRTTLCRSSSMRPGEVGGGWSRRTSPTVSRRFRTTS